MVMVTVILGTNRHSFLAPSDYVERTQRSLSTIYYDQVHTDFDTESGATIVSVVDCFGESTMCYTFQPIGR